MFSYISHSAHLLVKTTVCNRLINCVSYVQCVYVCGMSPYKILRGLLVIRIRLDAKEIFITPIITITAYTYLRFVRSRKVGLQVAERLGWVRRHRCLRAYRELVRLMLNYRMKIQKGHVRLALKWMFLLSFRSPIFSYLFSLPYFLYLPLSFVIYLYSCPFPNLSFRFFLLFFLLTPGPLTPVLKYAAAHIP